MKRAESPPRLDVRPNATCVSSFFSKGCCEHARPPVTCYAEFGRTIALEPVPCNSNRNRFHPERDPSRPSSRSTRPSASCSRGCVERCSMVPYGELRLYVRYRLKARCRALMMRVRRRRVRGVSPLRADGSRRHDAYRRFDRRGMGVHQGCGDARRRGVMTGAGRIRVFDRGPVLLRSWRLPVTDIAARVCHH